jgi:hypothetical protein
MSEVAAQQERQQRNKRATSIMRKAAQQESYKCNDSGSATRCSVPRRSIYIGINSKSAATKKCVISAVLFCGGGLF